MQTYLQQLKQVLEHGTQCDDRTGVGTLSYFGLHARYDLRAGFPAVTTKKLAWKGDGLRAFVVYFRLKQDR
jgi:thymidylate synthase